MMTDDQVRQDARRLFECVRAGGVAIFALDVPYAIGGHEPEALERIYRAKSRSPTKRNGALGSLAISEEVHVLEQRYRDVVRAVTKDHDLPMTAVAPVRMDHPFMRSLDPVVRDASTKNGTLSLLINGGPLLNATGELCLEHSYALVGSSANVSLEGSNYSLDEVEPEIRAAADEVTDYGRGKWANGEGLSSSIISLPDFKVIRFGIAYERIREIIGRHFGEELPERGEYVHIEQIEEPLERRKAADPAAGNERPSSGVA